MSQIYFYLIILVILYKEFPCKDHFLKFLLKDKLRNEIFEYKIKSDQNISNLIKKILIDLEINSIEKARSEYKLSYNQIDLLSNDVQDSKIYIIFNPDINNRSSKIELILNSVKYHNSFNKQELLKRKFAELMNIVNSDKKLNFNYINTNIRDRYEESIVQLKQNFENSIKILKENINMKEEFILKINDIIKTRINKNEIGTEEDLESLAAPFLIDKFEEFLKLKLHQINKVSEEIESKFVFLMCKFI